VRWLLTTAILISLFHTSLGIHRPPSPFKHCLGELSAAGSTSGNYTCKVTGLGAGDEYFSQNACAAERHWRVQLLHNAGSMAAMIEEWRPVAIQKVVTCYTM